MTLADPKHRAKSLCVKLKRLTSEILKNAKCKCEIEINELKVEDGEGEHDLEIDGTLVKMKTAFIKIKNRSTLSLTDLDDQESEEMDNKEVSLEESLDKILSEENIASLGEGWRKEIVRRSPLEAVIVCVKTPDNVELHSVGEAEQYLHSVGVKDVDVEKLFSSPPTPSKHLNNEVVEHEVVEHEVVEHEGVKELNDFKDMSETSILDASADIDASTDNLNLGKEKSAKNECGSENTEEQDCTNVQAVLVEPDSAGSDEASTTTTDSLDKTVVGDGEKKMTEIAVGDINDNRDVGEKNAAPSKPTSLSKKRKLVQTNMFAFLGQGQCNKKVKLDDQEDPLEDKNYNPTEVEITGNVLNGDHRILEKVTVDQPLGLDDNSNVQESDVEKCLPEDINNTSENVVPDELTEVLEKVHGHLNYEESVAESHSLNEPITADIPELDDRSLDSAEEEHHCESEFEYEKDKSGYFKCKFCEYKAKNKTDIKKHNNKKHLNDHQLPSDEVDSEVLHNLEADEVSNKLSDGRKSQSHKCTQCNIAFKTADTLELHIFYFHGAGAEIVFEVDEYGDYLCAHCEHKVKNQKLSNIKNHVFRRHWRKKEKHVNAETNRDTKNKVETPDISTETEDNDDFGDTVSNAPADDDDTDQSSKSGDNSFLVESSDLPEGWKRLKVPRKAVGKFDMYVQNPDGRRFNCQKKLDVFIAKNRLNLKNVKFRFSDGNDNATKEVKHKKQPCKESNNIPEEGSKELQQPVPPKKKKNKQLDKENKAEKKQREKKPKTEMTDMCVTDKEIDESEENEELTENELQYIAEIDEFMKETNLQLEPKPATKGDGNCWYRAAACQVIFHKIPNKPRNHKSMRLEVSNHLKNLPEQVKEDTINVVYLGRPRGLADLASRQRKAGQWVDNMGVMVLATAHYLGRNIHLYGYPTGSETQSRLFSLTRIEGGDQADKHPPLTIFYHDRHYQTLQPPESEEHGQE